MREYVWRFKKINFNGIRPEDKAPLLMVAVMNKDLETMKLLLHQSAAVHAKNSGGIHAIQISAAKGHLEGIKLLTTRRSLVSIGNEEFNIPLMFAAFSGNCHVIDYLVKSGVSV
ncbi:hypothetical protein ACTXT7_016865 [Hymenolepis weldensis]